MNAKQNRTKTDCPKDILDYLPLIANDTCPTDKREEIRALLEKNPACKAELEQFETISRLVREDAEQVTVPSDALQNEIMSRIGEKEEEASFQLRDWLASLTARLSEWFPRPAVRYAVAFAVLIIIFQSAIILHQSKRIATYHTLSGPATVVPGRISLNVIFNPEARVETIQAFLSKYHGQIVGGPGVSGVYTISVPKPEDPKTLLQELKGCKDLIQFAEIRN